MSTEYKIKDGLIFNAFQLKPNIIKPEWLTDCELVETINPEKTKVSLIIKTVTGSLYARTNDWIVKTYKDQYLILDDEIFNFYFEEV